MDNVIEETKKITYPLTEIASVAKTLLTECGVRQVWTLQGAMGSGKTTLVKAIMHELGAKENVTSPTFSLINEYQTKNGEPVYHFDFYRLNNEMEAFDIGTDEYFDSGHLCLIEWPEKIPMLIPPFHFNVSISLVDEQTRTLYYRKHG
ncbi:MAG: tRNA (adenosine(37)-N6)-threonylcarbamoyltransferase complex ATPase subunit type 1 TsaE [Bacteroidetes bacterium]|nr:tRNA (adenosine(37)-N6)-threonylcarbamoyltransferase complex ATPase subunit type 1 TsaE [Bacteroidota bacterium]MBS1541057.1 tRNA (adenosine(37)-N6)-threonylcarbamoyltransferase complex ATPase subunit type 1 TsaE [Bacteroidota bacterium]